ncbi:MAG: poly(beta-D-mannuronate) O-acetylase [Cyanobacteria bacterium RYN_339]|nr:poly(beta-D-mannuronate) O-acetylase [Cyanobacteria bacterium RYN_339]
MLFNSWQFLLFFPLVTAIYFALPHRARWGWLLAASCWFYMAFVPAYILILAFTIAVDYAAGIAIGGAQGRRRRIYLYASLAANLGVLACFKYFNFANANLAALAGRLHWNYPVAALGILLPIGLSFHVFQSLSYTIEVYRGNQAPERHLGIFALYVMFYPQLVAGPIERPQNLLYQFREPHAFDAERVGAGLKRMLWGLVKKVVIADRLAMVVNAVYAQPTQYHGLPLLLATVFFTFQIYCDFSGYSDIALGAAEVMGFRLMENFKQPYGARSVAEFWTRWHVSLSTWFRDYLYIPLGGNRVPPWRWALNILAVFMVSGLWHGANWTFVVWGGLHGGYLVVERACQSLWPVSVRLPAAVGTCITFALVAFAWIFFRAPSLEAAWYIAGHLLQGLPHQLAGPHAVAEALRGLIQRNIVLGVLGIGLLLAVERGRPWGGGFGFARVRALEWGTCYGLILALIVYGVYENQSFIYFQF